MSESRLRRLATVVAAAASRLRSCRAAPVLSVVAVAASPLLAAAFVARAFGVRDLLAALQQAHPGMLLAVLMLSVLLQVLRAARARRLLAGAYPVAMRDSYGPMILGHGIGDLIPLAPGGPALRCLLTERMARVPIPFSAGAFAIEGVLDGVGLAAVSVYLLSMVSEPSSTRGVLLWAAMPPLGVLGLSLALALFLRRRRGASGDGASETARRRYARQLALGLSAVFGQGVWGGITLVTQTILITLFSVLQIVLFLRAFDLAARPEAVLLVVVLTMAAGAFPIKFPGSGTVTADAALSLAGIHGGGAAGYVLASRVLFSSQATVLAVLLLLWWGWTGFGRRAGVLAALRRGLRAAPAPGTPQPVPVPVRAQEQTPGRRR